MPARTKNRYSRRAFGYFLHHTPAEAMATPTLARDGIKRAWRLACVQEGMDPKTPAQLPLLFAIDGLLNIPGGFTYRLHCDQGGSGIYRASHIGCSSGCAGDSGAGDAADSGGGGCGGGCGGD